jgi:dihydropteroate synthase
MILRARQFEFSFPRPAMIMGILNVTPDSFFDGGRFFQTEAAVAHAQELIAEGAEILDIGGESTRPFAAPVSAEEELRRVLPVIESLAKITAIPIAIDTQKTVVAAAAITAGAAIVNDVGAARADQAMRRLVAESGAAYVAMHSQGTPQTMQINPVYEAVTTEVVRFFQESSKQLASAGVKSEQIIFDPGIGFGKTTAHNLELIAQLGRFAALGRPVLLGVSRKAFLGGGAPDRLPGALACACWGAQAPAHIFRVHDVAATRQAVRLTETLAALRKS